MPSTSVSRHPGPMSPPPSTSSQAFTISQQQKLNVVTRLAIEGKAKHGQDGASIKMYLKISLPLEAVSPGTTLPLFPEENIKILTSQVHPIDGNSVPYNFSSTTCPLLHNAARALNLPARSSMSYLSNFGLSHPSPSSTGSSSRSSSNGINPPPLDDKYTGHILVSGYNVSYVLPKEFPRFKWNSIIDNEEDSSIRPTPMTPFKGKRASIGEKNAIQFMAAIDMWVPYLSRPPRAPYLLSIPSPRCLSNYVKLRIFPPTPTSASFASLSSAEEDGGTWDLTSDPHVTRSASTRLSRTNSYSNFADDESSDSSTAGFSDGCGIQGTFPSTERLRVRWAPPLKTIDVPNGGDGRRRVGVREAKAEMTCVVLGKGRNKNNGTEGVVMNIEYKGTCKGVWFPGVATLLGMDVGLESKGSDVTWLSESESKWSVGGGLGYTGFDMGVSPHTVSKQSSTGSGPQIFILPSSPEAPGLGSRQNSTSSTSSLLRAPLPAPNVPDFSFEGSATSSAPSGTISSIGSLPPSSVPNIERKRSSASINDSDPQERLPGVPITIHINMNDLLPPSKNTFTFTISGTVLVTPRPRSYSVNSQSSSPSHSDSETDPEPIILPRFSVLAADAETTSFLIRNEVAQAAVEVYNSSGDIRDAQTRKTVLQKGGFTRCGSDGGRIALRSFRPTLGSHRPPPRENVVESGRLSPSRPRTPIRVPSPSSSRPAYTTPLRPRRDGRLMIPSVMATVTPWLNGSPISHNSYTVRLCLPAPCDAGSEWLEFGFAQGTSHPSVNSPNTAVRDCQANFPQLHIASVSIDGVPVRFETSAPAKQELDGLPVLGLPFTEVRGKQWVSWVKIHVAGRGGGNVLVDYMVTGQGGDIPQGNTHKGKGKARDETPLSILLPTFSLPVGRLEVIVEINSNMELSSLQSNLTHQDGGGRLLQLCTEELFHPWLSLSLHPSSRSQKVYYVPISMSNSLGFVTRAAPAILSLMLLFCLIGLGMEIHQMKHTLDTCSTLVGSTRDEAPAIVTVTTTALLYPSSHSRWWFGETSSIDSLTVITSPSLSSATPTTSADFSSPRLSSSLQSDAATIPSVQTCTSAELTSIIGGENDSLVLFDVIPFPWLIPFDLPPPVQAAVDKILEGLGIVWVVFRRVYHYPLDPPP